MKKNQITTRAMVRLEAFKILTGWGTTTDGQFKPWGQNRIKEEAAALADWAMELKEQDPDPAPVEGNPTASQLAADRILQGCGGGPEL